MIFGIWSYSLLSFSFNQKAHFIQSLTDYMFTWRFYIHQCEYMNQNDARPQFAVDSNERESTFPRWLMCELYNEAKNHFALLMIRRRVLCICVITNSNSNCDVSYARRASKYATFIRCWSSETFNSNCHLQENRRIHATARSVKNLGFALWWQNQASRQQNANM